MLDNVAGLVLTVSLLAAVFGFPTSFAMGYMVPGTAVGVLVGDILFFWIALRVARRTGRNDITAMPLGLDTPSTFGMIFFVLGPAFLSAKEQFGVPSDAAADDPRMLQAAMHTWHIGICCIFVSGIFKLACAGASNWIRSVIPRAGLLGSLASIALVLICFLPLVEIFHYPIVALVALAIVLTTLIARVPLPGRIPGALGAVLVAGTIYYIMNGLGLIEHDWGQLKGAKEALLPTGWFSVFQFTWLESMDDALKYLPIVIPFALATVVGGIDCTESAAAAGDEYNTNQVIGVEAFATLVASLCGGVIQTTPYIGHPAYKAMGGRAAYTLATALFVGGAGILGYFNYLYVFIPKATVYPILVFIGLEITAQSFYATPKRHYPAVAFACIPALATLVYLFANLILKTTNIGIEDLKNPILIEQLHTVLILQNGFIITSLLWATILAAIIDRRMWTAATFLAVTAGLTLFGVMHSPLLNGRMFLPWQLPELLAVDKLSQDLAHAPYRIATGYLLVALMMLGLGWWLQRTEVQTEEAKK